MRRIFQPLTVLTVVGLCFSAILYAESEVKFKVLAVNPSESKPLKTVISQPLPSEIDPAQDIIDKAGLEVRFDAEKNVYTLSGEVELKPRETKTFEVRVRDVWQVTPEKVDETQKDLEEQINGLKGTKFFDTAKLLYEKAKEGMDRIVAEQSRPMGMKQHIELYRAHVQQLEDIKSNGLSLAAMRKLEDEKKKGFVEARFLITAENPSSEPKTMTVRSLLPKELKAEDILDKLDFDLLYDQSQKAYTLEKQDQFAAKETKKFIITVKDVWRISDQDIKFTKDQTEKLMVILKETPFGKYAEDQGKIIIDILSGISKLQQELESSLSLEERMRAFVLNGQQMNVARSKLHNLQQLISEAGLKKDDEAIKEKIKEFVKKLADMKNIVLMAMGIKPNTPMVWWIIFGIILFLGVLSSVFYMTWLKKLQENRWGAKGADKNAKTVSPSPPKEEVPAEKKEK